MDRLSGYDTFFLELESTTQPLNVCSLLELKTTTMPGGYSFDRFADALAARVSALPDLRLKLADSQLNLANPVWVEDEDFRLDRHLHRVGLPRPGGRYELAEICGHLAALPLDRDHPLWEMWLIEPADDADALAVMLKSHHAALDGVAGADLMLQLCSLVPDAPKPDRVDGPGTPNLVAIAVSGLVDFVRRPLRLVTLVPDTVTTIAQTVARARSGRAMARPFAAPVTAFNAPFTARRNVAFTQLELADIKTIKNRFGITVNDVLTALCSGALRRFLLDRDELPEMSLVATVPMSVRDKADRPGRNQTMWMFCRLATDLADASARLNAIAQSNAVAKDHGSSMPPALLQDLTEFVGRSLLHVFLQLLRNVPLPERPIHNLVLSNVRGPSERVYFLGCEIEALYPFGPIVIGAGLNITGMSVSDKLGVGIITCPDLIDNAWDLADAFQSELKELLNIGP